MSRIHTRILSLLITAVLALFALRADAAQVDLFLQIPEAPGESMDMRHKDWIDVVSYDELVAGSSRSFVFLTKVSRAYPKLLAATTSGQTYKLVTLELRKAGTTQLTFMIVKFEAVRIASVTTAASSLSDGVPLVRVAFTCDRATWSYSAQRPDGTLEPAIVFTTDFRGPAPLVLPELPRR